jgi:hypothetical protein
MIAKQVGKPISDVRKGYMVGRKFVNIEVTILIARPLKD